MLENGLITFDLFWALWKPGTLAFTTTYGSPDEPRVFKVESAEKHFGIMKGASYLIDGKVSIYSPFLRLPLSRSSLIHASQQYFEYDGKQFGFGTQFEEVPEFRGARKITSLSVYPLSFHKTEEQVRKDLIERGKKFVSLAGVNYRAHHGMAYYKKKRSIVKVNINGRIMIDPSIHRRINPNYPISHIRPKDHDIISDQEDNDADDADEASNSDGVRGQRMKFVTKAVKDQNGKIQLVRMPRFMAERNQGKEKLDQVQEKGEDDAANKAENAEGSDEDASKEEADAKKVPEFSDEDYLTASPVVLGFAFAEKLWLEFTVSGVKDIQWNETAYESLVLEAKTKDIVKVSKVDSSCLFLAEIWGVR